MTAASLLSQVRASSTATRRAVGRCTRCLNNTFRSSTRRPKAAR